MAVYIISHKKTEYPHMKGYELFQVGAKNKDYYCEKRDESGDNISEKNPSFCELTGLYWIWKNIKEDDYIGIVHYRRFFCNSFLETNFLKENRINKVLKDYDIILPISVNMNRSVRAQFLENTGTEEDLQVLEEILTSNYTDYLDSYNEYMNGHKAFFRNMFITRKDIYDNYCDWLFGILFEVENRLDTSQYDSYHKRIFGFLSERLLGVYVLKNELNVKQIGVVQTDLTQNPIKRFAKRFQRLLYR